LELRATRERAFSFFFEKKRERERTRSCRVGGPILSAASPPGSACTTHHPPYRNVTRTISTRRATAPKPAWGFRRSPRSTVPRNDRVPGAKRAHRARWQAGAARGPHHCGSLCLKFQGLHNWAEFKLCQTVG
jgi:hypothetical protein